MNSNYQAYLNHLTAFAESHSLVIQAETNVYPLFTDINNLFQHYKNTIRKFDTVEDELILFIKQLQFDDRDFDYYQELLLELRKVDGYLEELKTKQIPASISNEVQQFITQTYSSTSLYGLKTTMEHVLFIHNKVAETIRYEQYEKDKKANQRKTAITLVVVIIIVIIIVASC